MHPGFRLRESVRPDRTLPRHAESRREEAANRRCGACWSPPVRGSCVPRGRCRASRPSSGFALVILPADQELACPTKPGSHRGPLPRIAAAGCAAKRAGSPDRRSVDEVVARIGGPIRRRELKVSRSKLRQGRNIQRDGPDPGGSHAPCPDRICALAARRDGVGAGLHVVGILRSDMSRVSQRRAGLHLSQLRSVRGVPIRGRWRLRR